MSKARARRNRGEKKFIDKEEDDLNMIGVEDVSEVKNKIQEKQEDMFDPHQLKQNILQEYQQSKHTPQVFVDFEDDETNGPIEKTSQVVEEELKKEEEPAKKKGKRERGRREVKKFDEESEEEEKVEKKKQESIFQREQLDEYEPPTEAAKQSSKLEQPRQSESDDEEGSQDEHEKMKQMVMKKTPVQQNNYVMMHTIMNKAGINKEERRRAIYTPLQPNQHSFVYFKRNSSGFSENYQAIGQDQRPILFCENQRGCIGCNYYISLTKEMDKNNPAYLGKLRGNAAGSIYQLYDFGLQPNNDYDRSKFRVSMGYIEYESNFLGMKGPRKLRAIIPKVQDYEDFDMFKFSEEESLSEFAGSNVVRFRNKSPRWNERLKSYALNFGGRVKQASIKNFILVDDACSLDEEEKIPSSMVFGKIDENSFALEFTHPLSLFQAFGIAMSEFDFKLKCE